MTSIGPVKSPLRYEWMAHLGGMAVLSGVQLISPALPAMAERFALSQSELSLVISVYLIPATLASVPAGLLADRIGRRWVFGGGLCLFGLASLFLPLAAQYSFGALLVMRFLQGLGFAPAFPLTITILGDLYKGPALVSAQGRRAVMMHVADGGYPILGGILVGLSWLAPGTCKLWPFPSDWWCWLLFGIGCPWAVRVGWAACDGCGARCVSKALWPSTMWGFSVSS